MCADIQPEDTGIETELEALEAAANHKSTGKFSKRQWGIIGVIAVIIIAIAIGVGISHAPADRLKEQLQLGQKYLKEMKYEEAVVAFNNAIAIDPMSVEAYLGLAEVYIRTGDFDTAYEYAKKGYDLTGDERLKEKMEMIESGNITASNGQFMKESYYQEGELVEYLTYTYDLLGRRKTVSHYNAPDQLVSEGECQYDEQGNTTLTYDLVWHNGNPFGELSKWEYEYDEEGNWITERLYDGSGGLNYYGEHEYDEKGQRIVSRGYDGDDRILGYTEYEYDAEGRKIVEKHYNGHDGYDEASCSLSSYTEYEYDEEERVIAQRDYDVSGSLRFYYENEYDKEGRQIARKSYDEFGKLRNYYEYERDDKGRVIAQREYDASGKLIGETKNE